MTSTAVFRRSISLIIAGTLTILPFPIQHLSATSLTVKEGDMCTKVKATTRSKSGIVLTCTRVGSTKVLKWKRIVTKPVTIATTTLPTVTTVSQITIQDFAFIVAGNVKSSDILRVTNRDGSTHTLTSDIGVFDVTVVGDATRNLPSLNAGSYTFFCRIHTSMRGTLKID